MPAWTFNNFVRTPLLLLGIVELAVLYSAAHASAWLLPREIKELPADPDSLPLRAALFAAINFAALIAMGLYQFHQRLYFREAAARVLVAIAAGSLGTAVLFYALPSIQLTRELALVSVVYSTVLLLTVRYFFLRHVDENVFRRRTLIYGAGDRSEAVLEFRRRADRRGFKLLGRVAAPGDNANGQSGPGNVIELNGRSILELASQLQADEIVVAMDDRRGNLPVRELLDCRLQGIEIIDLLEFLERETGKIRVDLVNPGWLVFSAGFRKSRLNRFSKRSVDVLVSSIMFLLALPVMLLVAAAIKLEDGFGAPVIYRQRRVGLNNRNFDVLKFRSMHENAERDGAVWAAANDSRVTRVGAVLRKYRLDELPQIVNVLRGQMSLVGPRPERPEFVSQLSERIPYYAERHTVKPGVTGWAQLKYAYGANEDDAIEKLQYDLYYIKNQSLLLDIMIILQTVEVVLWGKGAR